MRVFVAVAIPEDLKEKLTELGKEIEQDGIKLVAPQNIHMTMKFIGEVPDETIEEIEAQLKDVKFKKFECTIKGVGVFPNENYIRVVWAGVDSNALDEVAKKVMDVLANYGKKEKFSGHATIARVKKKVNLKGFLEKHRNDEFGKFNVSEFKLIQSDLGKEGPTYTTLATFKAEEDV
jgi:2'-5' RNA ligase